MSFLLAYSSHSQQIAQKDPIQEEGQITTVMISSWSTPEQLSALVEM
ncbi:MAG: hypothetical protein ACJA01_003654 [Saprospiraceae bacterium]|jgi:hypothetical protein